jgi:phage terminase small subunit
MPRTVKEDANLQPGKPLKPANLSDRASQEWDRLLGELADAKIQVTTAHRIILAAAATIAADMARAWEVVQTEGAYLTNAKTGAVTSHPASKQHDALKRDLQKWLVMLGLRAAVAGEGKTKTETLDDILKG